MTPENDAALLLVDLQNDFCPGGALQVPAGDRVLEPANRAAALFASLGLPVIASRDWHPAVTRHFRSFGGSWPVHCVQETPGAAFHPALHLPENTLIISKGIDPKLDGYSAFEGVDAVGQPLGAILAGLKVRHLYLAGLATDYCVLFTGREALQNGYRVTVLTDAVAGVDLLPGDAERALEELVTAGARLLTTDQLRTKEKGPAV